MLNNLNAFAARRRKKTRILVQITRPPCRACATFWPERMRSLTHTELLPVPRNDFPGTLMAVSMVAEDPRSLDMDQVLESVDAGVNAEAARARRHAQEARREVSELESISE